MDPPSPPVPDWTSTEFNNAAAMPGYDSTKMAFVDSSGTDQYLYVGLNGTGHTVAWYLRPTSNCGSCVQAKIPTLTKNVILNGKPNYTTNVITYSGTDYLLHLQVDSSGNIIALSVVA